MMNEIAQAIANVVIFFEYSPPEILDEDCAIQAMEQLGADLSALDETSRHALAASFRIIALNYEGELKSFVEDLPGAFGLEEPPEEEGL